MNSSTMRWQRVMQSRRWNEHTAATSTRDRMSRWLCRYWLHGVSSFPVARSRAWILNGCIGGDSNER